MSIFTIWRGIPWTQDAGVKNGFWEPPVPVASKSGQIRALSTRDVACQ